MIDWEKRFPMFGLTRQHLKDAGLKEAYIKLLDDKDMQSISTHAGSLLLANGSFADAITFSAWNCILGTKLDSNTHERQLIEDGLDKKKLKSSSICLHGGICFEVEELFLPPSR